MWTHPLVRAGLVLGLGFGGFADGIVLHQILGWHHLVCVTAHCQPNSIAQLQLANTQDGYFHLALWLVSLVGMVMLFRAARHAGPAWVDAWTLIYGTNVPGLWPKKCVLPRYSPIRTRTCAAACDSNGRFAR